MRYDVRETKEMQACLDALQADRTFQTRYARVKTLLRENPRHKSLKSHPVQRARGELMSSRVTQSRRLIWRWDAGDEHVIWLVEVDEHDDAYQRGERVDTTSAPEWSPPAPAVQGDRSKTGARDVRGLLDHCSTDELLLLGFDEDEQRLLRSVTSEDELLAIEPQFPTAKHRMAMDLADGIAVAQVLANRRPEQLPADPPPAAHEQVAAIVAKQQRDEARLAELEAQLDEHRERTQQQFERVAIAEKTAEAARRAAHEQALLAEAAAQRVQTLESATDQRALVSQAQGTAAHEQRAAREAGDVAERAERAVRRLAHHPLLQETIEDAIQVLHARSAEPDLPPVGGVWPYEPGPHRYTLYSSQPDIAEVGTGRLLSAILGPDRAAAVARRLLLGRPTGGRIRVDEDGDVSTRPSVGGREVYLGRMHSSEWFPGVITISEPLAPAVVLPVPVPPPVPATIRAGGSTTVPGLMKRLWAIEVRGPLPQRFRSGGWTFEGFVYTPCERCSSALAELRKPRGAAFPGQRYWALACARCATAMAPNQLRSHEWARHHRWPG